MEDRYEVEVRDLNGKRTRIEGTGYEIIEALAEGGTLCDDEVMWVAMNGQIIWCELGNEPITAEDIVGFVG